LFGKRHRHCERRSDEAIHAPDVAAVVDLKHAHIFFWPTPPFSDSLAAMA
jgi:hypothetical protein